MTSGSRDQAQLEWSTGTDPGVLPEAVRRSFAALAGAFEIRPISGGLLHRSFHVRAGDSEYVLQRVSDVFAPEIHDNIQAVTRHLAARGLQATSLVPTLDGDFSIQLGELGRWRLMPHLGGASFRRLQSVDQARSVGQLVGRFHAATLDFELPLAPMGIPYRDTPHYLAAMRQALETRAEHRLFAEIAPLGRRILEAFDALGPPPDVRSRVIHGDLKLENVLFQGKRPPERDRAFALIDLDTLMRAPLWVELGDAWRSWCNPAGEDTTEARFDMSFFEASAMGFFDGYGEPLSDIERDSLVTAPERVSLELCSRYATDALDESYFGWDDSSFATRGEHNLVRAHGQWRFYEAVCACRRERNAILQNAT